LPLDAARSPFSSADTGVKTRELVDRADNVWVVARGVESSQVALTTRTPQSRRTVRVREAAARPST
jgi:hypothetical protein